MQTVPLRWQALGADWAAFRFRRVPSLGYLYGSVGDDREDESKAAKVRVQFSWDIFCVIFTRHIKCRCQIARMRTPPSRKTSQAKKGSATRVVSRKSVGVEDDDDTMVKKMVKVSSSKLFTVCSKTRDNRIPTWLGCLYLFYPKQKPKHDLLILNTLRIFCTREPSYSGDVNLVVSPQSLHDDFCREFKKNHQRPINFYEFVCDPKSFANTVENIFHVSFLIKDRKVAMVDSEESSLPELIPINFAGNSGHIVSGLIDLIDPGILRRKASQSMQSFLRRQTTTSARSSAS